MHQISHLMRLLQDFNQELQQLQLQQGQHPGDAGAGSKQSLEILSYVIKAIFAAGQVGGSTLRRPNPPT